MLTHYIRRQKKIGLSTKVESVLESILLESIPYVKLVTYDDLEDRFYKDCVRNKERIPGEQATKNLLDILIQKRFVIELNRVKLEKILDTL